MSYVFLSLHVQGSTPCGIKFQHDCCRIKVKQTQEVYVFDIPTLKTSQMVLSFTGYIFHLIDCCQSDFTEDVGQLLYIHRKILLLLLL